MTRFRQEEGEQRFRNALSPRTEDVHDAMSFFATRVTESMDSDLLLNRWWKVRRTPPVERLILDHDFNFEVDCERAARYWEARLAGAAALEELVKQGYLATEGQQQRTEEVRQGFTTVTPESGGGTTGSFDVSSVRQSYPSRVRPPAFAKPWDGPTKDDAGFARESATASVARPLGVIVSNEIREEAIGDLELLEGSLRALVDTGELTPESKRLITEQAYPLMDELRDILRRVTDEESERRNWVKQTAAAGGKLFGTLHGAARLTAPFTGVLASAPGAIKEGTAIVEAIMANLG
jgi:hypothetical protein